jgi:hypothetical protein
VQVEVTRSGAKKSLTVKLGERPDTTATTEQQEQPQEIPGFGGGW